MKFLCILLLPLALLANSPEQNSQLFGAFTLLPPFIAIVLAFVTKDVILSLFLGAMSGTFMLALVSNGYGASELIGAQNAAQALADTLDNATQNLSTTQALESAGKTKRKTLNLPHLLLLSLIKLVILTCLVILSAAKYPYKTRRVGY